MPVEAEAGRAAGPVPSGPRRGVDRNSLPRKLTHGPSMRFGGRGIHGSHAGPGPLTFIRSTRQAKAVAVVCNTNPVPHQCSGDVISPFIRSAGAHFGFSNSGPKSRGPSTYEMEGPAAPRARAPMTRRQVCCMTAHGQSPPRSPVVRPSQRSATSVVRAVLLPVRLLAQGVRPLNTRFSCLSTAQPTLIHRRRASDTHCPQGYAQRLWILFCCCSLPYKGGGGGYFPCQDCHRAA